MNAFEFADATSVNDAMSLLQKNSAIKAGGIDLLDLMKERVTQPARLVNIRNLRELDFIQIDNGGALQLGPLATLARIAANTEIQARFTALAQATGSAATPQVRNMATVGGNLLQRPRCWYFRSEDFHCRKKGGETCFAQDGENQYHAIFNNKLCAIVHPSAAACPLVALGATVELAAGSARRQVKLEEFFTLPSSDLHRENLLASDELLTRITIPALPPGTKSAYGRQGEKESFDWPVAECAVVIERDGKACKRASIVLGAAAPVPHRAVEAEKLLTGKELGPATAREAARAAIAGATPLSRNAYKLLIFAALVERVILSAGGVQ
jgi:xanthine dehydrogenase YagS FAD-binding subunit